MRLKKKKQNFIPQKKSLSQVFLKDPWPCEKIAETLVEKKISHVLEIGPGGGALTKELLKRGISVFAVEKDERFFDLLSHELSENEKDNNVKFEIINQDILEFNLLEFLEKNSSVQAVCGNIPYSISTQIVSLVLPCLEQIVCSLLLVQLEFAERLASKPNKKSYGSLSVYTQLRAHINLDFVVDKKFFKPVPKVDSALVSLQSLEKKCSDTLLRKVEKVTKVCFSQRRKKLSNSLKPFLSTLGDIEVTLDLTRRCDNLSPEEFVALTKMLFPNLQ